MTACLPSSFCKSKSVQLGTASAAAAAAGLSNARCDATLHATELAACAMDCTTIMTSVDDLTNKITNGLVSLLSQIPESKFGPSNDPATKARAISQAAAKKSAAISGALSIPPGPLSLLTIVPDLFVVWRIQQQMVSDIAAVYGRKDRLTGEVMAYCLFKHSSTSVVQDLVARVGTRYMVKRATLNMLRGTMKKVGVRVARKLMGRSFGRLIPLFGAAAVAGYAYNDTLKVAATAIELFSRELLLER